jgi:CDP-paratose 2-epimerase
MQSISVVLPAKDEAATIGEVLDELYQVITHQFRNRAVEVIVVDDHSTDATASLATARGARVVSNEYPSGKGNALRYGFEQANGALIAMLDSDYSHKPAELPAMLRVLDEQKEIGLVVGSRIYGGSDEYTPIRALGNVGLTYAFGLLHGRYLSDALNGYKVFRRAVFFDHVYDSTDFEIEIELLVNTLRTGYRIAEIPSHERSRAGGQAKSRAIKHGTKFLGRIVREAIKSRSLPRPTPATQHPSSAHSETNGVHPVVSPLNGMQHAASDVILITGGCGFVGSNLAAHLLAQGHHVRVLDNLSRRGTRLNQAWLQSLDSTGRLDMVEGDIRDATLVEAAMQGVSTVYHLAAQVAVTTSVTDPRSDFDINALGTLNILEAVRQQAQPPHVIFTSTNKVYGATEHVAIREEATRYTYAAYPLGIAEDQPLDFHSPYGCSKGSADQYIIDYGRIYDIPTTVLRMSCIYGPRQFGNEDQGWIAHFLIRALNGESIAIYGDGKQVRDALYIDDLVRLFTMVREQREHSAGQVFNVGGSAANTVSIWREFGPMLERLIGERIEISYGDWRPGDQRVYISDIRKVQQVLGWSPAIGVEEGVYRLHEWLQTQPAIVPAVSPKVRALGAA